MKPKLTKQEIEKFEELYLISMEKIVGIYGIVFEATNSDDVQIYIGSSVVMINRCKFHDKSLQNNKHPSKKVQKIYNDPNYKVKFIILERCNRDNVMQKEREWQHRWSEKSLLNSWLARNEEDLRPYLEKAIQSKAYLNCYKISDVHFYNGTPCKESNTINENGYGRMRVKIGNKYKSLLKHTVAYWHEYGELVELVRHKCNNRACYNPHHLGTGNHSDNNLDKRGDFPEEFEKTWLRFQGDGAKITKHYGWSGNCEAGGQSISTAVYNWENKLGLREKYPDILDGANIQKRKSLWHRDDVKDFIQECEGLYSGYKDNVEIAQKFNAKFGTSMSAQQISCMREKIKGSRVRNRQRRKNYDKTGVCQIIKDNYEFMVDEDLRELCNSIAGTNYTTGIVRSLRYDMGLFKPVALQEHEDVLYRYMKRTLLGIEAEKFIEHFYMEYTDAELAEICAREYGEDKGFSERAVFEVRKILGLERNIGANLMV